jgi:predicted transcriptional regulator
MTTMAFTVRTDEELERALTELAEAEGLSRQEIVRRAVLERHRHSAHRERIDAVADGLIERYGEALDRLGSV